MRANSMRLILSTPMMRTGLLGSTRRAHPVVIQFAARPLASSRLWTLTVRPKKPRQWTLLSYPLSSRPPPQIRSASSQPPSEPASRPRQELHESPYTLPNALTLARLAACPFLGYAIVQGQTEIATGLLLVSGLSDWLDGYLARRWNQKSVLGSILDPMADKALMTTLVVTLTYKGLLPLPLALLIFGRDFALSMWAFYLRYISLPKPRTIQRYFDPSMPSAEVKPTQISKINTALQLVLMGATTISPLVGGALVGAGLQALQWTVAGTTIWSGLSYVGQAGYKILSEGDKDAK